MAKSNLQSELRKQKPFEIPEQEAGLNIARTADLMSLAFTRMFRPYGLSEPLYNILRILRGVGGKGLPCLEIAERMVTAAPDITRLIDRLVKMGLVTRERHAEDRRVIHVQVNEAGLELLARLDEPVVTLHKTLLGHLTRKELAEINQLMVKARHPVIPE